jgi:hypothetical protein
MALIAHGVKEIIYKEDYDNCNADEICDLFGISLTKI